jgi:lipopolysaccharide transport system permease protein
MIEHRSLILALARRDIEARYRGSFGGGLWTFLHPLLLMLTYYFVFGVVLQARFPGDPTREGFVLYFLAGMLPWLAMSETWGRSPTLIPEHVTLIKKVIFPVEILPVVRTLAALVPQAAAIAIFVALLFATRGAVPSTALWLPVLLIPQILLTLGVSYMLAAAGAFLRDLAQLIGFALTLLFFLTPICYPDSSLPAAALPILGKNPVYILVRGYRAIFIEARAPEWQAIWKLWLLSGIAFAIGYRWFRSLQRSFADVL